MELCIHAFIEAGENKVVPKSSPNSLFLGQTCLPMRSTSPILNPRRLGFHPHSHEFTKEAHTHTHTQNKQTKQITWTPSFLIFCKLLDT